MERLRNNPHVYGLGLSVAACPLTLLYLLPDPTVARRNAFFVALVCAGAVFGALASYTSGMLAFQATTIVRKRHLRIVLLVLGSFGLSFVIAAVPFLVFSPIGAMAAWLSVNTLWIPCLVVTTIWSTVYMVFLGPVGDGPMESLVADGGWGKLIWIIASSLVTTATLYFVIKHAFFKA